MEKGAFGNVTGQLRPDYVLVRVLIGQVCAASYRISRSSNPSTLSHLTKENACERETRRRRSNANFRSPQIELFFSPNPFFGQKRTTIRFAVDDIRISSSLKFFFTNVRAIYSRDPRSKTRKCTAGLVNY